jgi:hypothetical protein
VAGQGLAHGLRLVSHRRVDPSISVNRKVTVPDAGPTPTACHATIGGARDHAELRRPIRRGDRTEKPGGGRPIARTRGTDPLAIATSANTGWSARLPAMSWASTGSDFRAALNTLTTSGATQRLNQLDPVPLW